ncbi:MAG: DUF2384 domain-containing protein [Rhodanobacter sp.]
MSKKNIELLDFVREISRVNAKREQLIYDAFDALNCRHAELSQLVQDHVGTRQRAVIWMASHQRSLGGRTPYEAIAEDDLDSLWDLLDGFDDNTSQARHAASQMAY